MVTLLNLCRDSWLLMDKSGGTYFLVLGDFVSHVLKALKTSEIVVLYTY